MSTDHPKPAAPPLKQVLFRMVAEQRLGAEQGLELVQRLKEVDPAFSLDDAPPQAAAPGDIAVIGVAGRFADAEDLDGFWRMLVDGRHGIREAPPAHWAPASMMPGEPPIRGGFLREADRFDPLFFRISPTEARLMDPQQRVFLEQAYAALEDAGYSPADVADRRCGVFVGVGAGDYAHRLQAAGVATDAFALMGNVLSILTGRISYFLDLKGPAIAVDTACSSSLVAVHQACESLRGGTCDMALAGGVCILSTPQFLRSLTGAGMLSTTGLCRPFDAGADGFVIGEGAGAVVLKTLERALLDNDTIYGVIRASGLNQDGRTNGITAPNGRAQAALEREVHLRAGIDPRTISYVEAHGTATPLGDPIEVEALTAAFRASSAAPGSCLLGSVKSNIGHALAAAGIAGLIKVLLCLDREELPPSLHFERPSPHIDFASSPFQVVTRRTPWRRREGEPRRAAVSAFGFSGTNAHLVVEEAPARRRRREPMPNVPRLYLLSGRTPEALRRRAAALRGWLEAHPELPDADVCFTLAKGRAHHSVRTAIVARGRDELLARLCGLEGEAPDEGAVGVFRGDLRRDRDVPSAAIEERARELAGQIAAAQDRGASAPAGALDALGELYARGCTPDGVALAPDGQRVRLPAYPFEAQRFSVPVAISSAAPAPAASALPATPRPAPPPPQPTSTAALLEPIVAAIAARPAEPSADSGARAARFEGLERYGRARLALSMARMGVFDPSRRVLTSRGLQRRLQVLPRHARLLDALVDVLAREQVLRREDDLVRIVAPPTPEHLLAMPAELAAARARLADGDTGMDACLDLLDRCVDLCPDVLTGRMSAPEVLFPGGSMQLVERVYSGNTLAEHFHGMLAAAIGAFAEARLAAHPVRRLRILEVGAGTGGATAHVLPTLAAFADRIQLDFSDVSASFMRHARQRFGAEHPFVRFLTFDLERDPEDQGLELGSYDLVFASNVVHATRRIASSLERIFRLLQPGGLLLLNEVTSVQDFATLTFGLTDGWWAFEDDAVRLRHAPLLDVEGWTRSLVEAGFPDVRAFGPSAEAAPARFPQSLVLAQRDLRPVPAARARQASATPKAAPVHVGAAGSDLEAIVAREVAATLSLEVDQVDSHGRFMDYGIDSILGVELVARLNRVFGLSLKPTLLFEFSSVTDLSRYLKQTEGVRAPAAAHSTPGEEAAAAPSAEVRAARPAAAEDTRIAVIGLSARFADADDTDAFLAMLREGRCAVVEVPPERWDPDDRSVAEEARREARAYRRGGFLRGIELFDPLFFNISGKEAEFTDPQHRVFLMEAWKALEDAGYADTTLDGMRCGVFVGAHGGDYTHRMARDGVIPDAYGFMGNAASILAARISYFLNLRGPCLTVDTACSSSLVAIHLACQSLLAGECEMALVGGVLINTTMGFYVAAAQAGMLSPEGLCKAFDARADGFVPGEGAGVVVLKPLGRALADGDHIDAVILASGMNQDGRTNGITAPNPASQAELEREVHARAGVNPRDISYIETHGTGTPLGDPIEVEGLLRAFGDVGGQRGFCALGSVKTNIGHAAHAAGIAGFLKLALSLRERQLFPSLHFREENPRLHLGHTPFRVNTALRAWEADGRPLIGAVSSFGFSGTNAHVVLTEAPPRAERPASRPDQRWLLPLSAKTPGALQRRLHALRRRLEDRPPALEDLAFTLARGRSHCAFRWARVVGSVAELRQALDDAASAPLVGRARRATDAAHAKERIATLATARAAEEQTRLLEELAGLFREGHDLDWSQIYLRGRRISLPTYAFEQEWYWITPAPSTTATRNPAPADARPPTLLTPLTPLTPPTPPTPLTPLTAGPCYLAPRWEPCSIPANQPPVTGPGPWWIVAPPGARRDGLVAILSALGREVMALDAIALPADVGLRTPGAVLCLGGLEPSALSASNGELPDLAALDAELEAGAGVVLGVVSTLARASLRARVPVLYLHREEGGLVDPTRQAVVGFGRSLSLVDPHIDLRVVGLVGAQPEPAELAALVLAELSATASGGHTPEARYTAQRERQARALRLRARAEGSALPLRPRGTYLITGGAGGLGLVFARELVERVGARVALVGRSALVGERLAKVEALRREGAEIGYWSADVADPAAMAGVLREVEARFGPVRGVIHAAGVPGRSPVPRKDWAEFRSILQPKVHGAWALDRLLADRPELDFLVLFSSLVSVLGDFGQCDYAFANAFLDALATRNEALRERGLRKARTIALGWPMWREGGAHLPPEGAALFVKMSGLALLETEAGLTAFRDALLDPAPHLVVLAEAGAIPRLFPTTAAGPGATLAEAPSRAPAAGIDAAAKLAPAPTSAPDEGLRAATLGRLTRLSAELLRVDPARLRPEAGLNEFGFDSISLKDLAVRISAAYGVELLPAVFFAHGTLDSLAGYILDQHPDQVRAAYGRAPAPAVAPSLPEAATTPRAAAADVIPAARGEAAVREPVAIIGISGRFPASEDVRRFWDNLASGADLIQEVPLSRWDWRRYDAPRWGGFIPDVDCFDAGLFRMSPREARATDPQQRLFLETAWAALEDAGYDPTSLAGRSVGVFVGQQVSEYLQLLDRQDGIQVHFATGSAPAMLPNRLSYQLDLHGPSESVDTACSSALVAIHRAVRALQSGECEMALAGAVSLMLSPDTVVMTHQMGVLSPTGRCRTFDRAADGYVKGEGVAAVLLKPLSRARADGDPIYGVILGSAVNHGGRASSLTAPNPRAQAAVVAAAHREAGIPIETVSYIEAHGTGTELGDPVEIEGLKLAFQTLGWSADRAAAGSCGLGAVKTSTGHLEPASGMVGLAKVLMAMKHRYLPATLHFQELNPYIRLDGTPFRIIDRGTAWTAPVGPDGRPLPLRAGISSFGFGGANAHVVLESAEAPPPVPSDEGPELILLSARAEDRLKAYAERLHAYLEGPEGAAQPLGRIAWTLQVGRPAMAYRFAVVVRSTDDLRAALRAFLDGDLPPDLLTGRADPARADLLGGGEAARRFVAELMQSRHLRQLARLWVEGVALDFRLAPRRDRQRISLPTYPFARERHWVDASPPDGTSPPPGPSLPDKPSPRGPSLSHPLLGAPQGGEGAWRFSLRLPASAPLLQDHQVEGRSVLPGIVVAELARAAAELAGVTGPICVLRDLLWLEPLVGTNGLEVEARLVQDANGLAFTMHGERGQVAARCRLTFEPAPESPPDLDLPALRQACPRRLAGEVFYAQALRGGMRFGPSMQALRALHVGDGQALAEVELPAQALEGLALGPALLDAALQSTAGILAPALGEGAPLMLPFSIDEIRLFRPLPSRVLASPREVGQRREGLARFDIAIVDEAGRHCVLVRGFSLKAVEARPLSPRRATSKIEPAPRPTSARAGLRARAEEYLREVFAKVLGMQVEALDARAGFDTLGVDSFLAVELRGRLSDDFGDLPATLLFEHMSIEQLAGYLVGEHSETLARWASVPAGSAPAVSPAAPPAPSAAPSPSPAAPPVPSAASSPSPAAPPAPSAASSPSPLVLARRGEDIAIVGVSGRYPLAGDLDELWERLRQGTNCIREVPPDRWDLDAWYDPARTVGRIYTRYGGFMDDVAAFDPLFFRISPMEAESMDPQERLFLECVWATLEDAGTTPRALAGQIGRDGLVPVGVYVGVMYGAYQWYGVEDWVQGGAGLAQSAYWSIANRISYLFDFHGPSMAVDTACSSSLTAIHLACEALRRGECRAAIAGGVNVIIHPRHHIGLCALNMLSAGDRCRSFGAGADGFVDGEGVGAVLLKPLDEALAAGDRIHAVIKGSAVNAGGRTSGYTVPNPSAQAGLIRDALARAGVAPESVSFLEAHGTGTPLGDPIEVRSLSQAFGGAARERPCALGSIKSNIGHLESAAGVAGLTKVLLQLRHRTLAPTLHAEESNPAIDFSRTPFRLQRSVEPWESPQGTPRRAGISSFGAGGANAHLVVEEFAPSAEAPARDEQEEIILLSARTDERLRALVQRMIAALERPDAPPLRDVAWTLQRGREPLRVRLAVATRSHQDLLDAWRRWSAAAQSGPGVFFGQVESGAPAARIEVSLGEPDFRVIAARWAQGATIDWGPLHAARPGRVVSLPTYPFERTRYWLSRSRDRQDEDPVGINALLDGFTPTLSPRGSTP